MFLVVKERIELVFCRCKKIFLFWSLTFMSISSLLTKYQSSTQSAEEKCFLWWYAHQVLDWIDRISADGPWRGKVKLMDFTNLFSFLCPAASWFGRTRSKCASAFAIWVVLRCSPEWSEETYEPIYNVRNFLSIKFLSKFLRSVRVWWYTCFDRYG